MDAEMDKDLDQLPVDDLGPDADAEETDQSCHLCRKP